MKKLCVLACALLAMAAIMAMYPPRAEPATTAIVVPVTVHTGDTLNSICSELAKAYGDKRDLREITYYVQKHNNKWDAILPGDKLAVELLVERGAQLEKEKCR